MHAVVGHRAGASQARGGGAARAAARRGMRTTARAQCAARLPFLGFSMYDVLLDRWLADFPASQLCVIFTEELEAEPLTVMRGLEKFLGLPAHAYDELRGHGAAGWRLWRLGELSDQASGLSVLSRTRGAAQHALCGRAIRLG